VRTARPDAEALARAPGAAVGDGGQPQQPPPQHPPPPPLPPAGAGDGAEEDAEDDEEPTATVDSSFTVSSCPCGHTVGALDWDIGRRSSKVEPQVLQRYS
jgi:hypothetical protein